MAFYFSRFSIYVRKICRWWVVLKLFLNPVYLAGMSNLSESLFVRFFVNSLYRCLFVWGQCFVFWFMSFGLVQVDTLNAVCISLQYFSVVWCYSRSCWYFSIFFRIASVVGQSFYWISFRHYIVALSSPWFKTSLNMCLSFDR